MTVASGRGRRLIPSIGSDAISATQCLLEALVYAHGISGLWLDLAGALGLAALGLFLAARVRREGAVTLPEIVGRHFGPE